MCTYTKDKNGTNWQQPLQTLMTAAQILSESRSGCNKPNSPSCTQPNDRAFSRKPGIAEHNAHCMFDRFKVISLNSGLLFTQQFDLVRSDKNLLALKLTSLCFLVAIVITHRNQHELLHHSAIRSPGKTTARVCPGEKKTGCRVSRRTWYLPFSSHSDVDCLRLLPQSNLTHPLMSNQKVKSHQLLGKIWTLTQTFVTLYYTICCTFHVVALFLFLNGMLMSVTRLARATAHKSVVMPDGLKAADAFILLPLSCGSGDSSTGALWVRYWEEPWDLLCLWAFLIDFLVKPSTFSEAEIDDIFFSSTESK